MADSNFHSSPFKLKYDMCLGPEYFIEQSKRAEPFERRGYIHFSEIESLLGISEQQMQNLGLIEPKNYFCTTDLYDFQLTESGAEYFRSAPYQLLMLKPSKIRQLLLLFKEDSD